MAKKNNFKVINGGKKGAQAPIRTVSADQLNNDELEAKLEANRKEKTAASLEALVEVLRKSSVLIPARLDEQKRISFGMLKNEQNQPMVGIYTSKKHLPTDRVLGNLMLLPYPAVNNLIINMMKQTQVTAVVFNPFTQNMAFAPKLLEKIEEAEKKQKETGEHVKVILQETMSPAAEQVHNEEAEALAAQFGKESDEEEKNKVLNQLLNKLNGSNIVLAVTKDANDKDSPELLVKKETGEMRLPVYTAPKLSLHGTANRKIAIMKFEKAVEMAVKMPEDKVKGITLITPTISLNIERPLLNRILEVNEKKAAQAGAGNTAAAQKVLAELTDEQKASIAHQQFAFIYLPKQIKERGQELIDDICSRRETAVDELFEKSYYDIRMYPYLEKEFQVMPLGVAENTDAIRIDLPERDQTVGCAARVYIIWDNAEKTARYFVIGRGPKQNYLAEIVDGKVGATSPAPEEGTELRAILDLAEIKQ